MSFEVTGLNDGWTLAYLFVVLKLYSKWMQAPIFCFSAFEGRVKGYVNYPDKNYEPLVLIPNGCSPTCVPWIRNAENEPCARPLDLLQQGMAMQTGQGHLLSSRQSLSRVRLFANP